MSKYRLYRVMAELVRFVGVMTYDCATWIIPYDAKKPIDPRKMLIGGRTENE